MTKTLFIIGAFISLSFMARGQNMNSIFLSLPQDCFSDLDINQKKLLLSKKEYLLPNGDSIETVKYTIDIDEEKSYINCEMSFTTGQNGFSIVQIKKFTKKDGEIFIVFAKYGGLLRSYYQQQVRCFKYQDKKLVDMEKTVLPDSLPLNKYVAATTPNSVKTKLQNDISTSYDLDPDFKNAIVYRIFWNAPLTDMKKYVLGNSVVFIWNGQTFIQGRPRNID